jgi:orotidine-5'-phosphate decarboxylase
MSAMSTRNFSDLVRSSWDLGKFLCVGLDSDFQKLPMHLRKLGAHAGIVAFNKGIIDATKDIAGSYKLNSAFYESEGVDGLQALLETSQYLREVAADLPVILDAKRADIGNTNAGYVTSIFEYLGMDAVTVHPYLGREALSPFLERKEKGIIVLCRTSNAGSGEFQDLVVDGEPLYLAVARAVATSWNNNGNCSLVVGATYPEEMHKIRTIAPEIPFLIPGIGAQGGEIDSVVRVGKNAHRQGMMISSSRAIIFASSGEGFAQAARTKAQEVDGVIRKSV